MTSRPVSLRDIAEKLGISVKTVSGALNNNSIRMSEETRERIRTLADEMGYQPNEIARGMRAGVMPIVGLLADGLVTQPFATEILRQFDNLLRSQGLTVIVTSIHSGEHTEKSINELRRLMPQQIVYASMFHQAIDLPEAVRRQISLMLNCFDIHGEIPSLVPDEEFAGYEAATFLLDGGRKRIAYLDLPGLIAGSLRAAGFRRAMSERGETVRNDWLMPATKGALYSDRARSLVKATIEAWFSASEAPDGIICGNDRVAMEVYNSLRRVGRIIPDDVAIISFDNQVDIARRLDPPLTTMALPHREIGRFAGDIVTGRKPIPQGLARIPFRLVERSST
ncbi:LacI family DNA-binding transcriptional regulator [Rhizobium calliandrae]|uniref:LacI family DNA-binding transcriptional regulator n=1 Tax=Rhizobium calliandrae TaxID=1312182 RepID=A0ABT7KJ93_9HYPH|nr:LacI family DNA-binding transcriptional regulator [Rhizobium calliandrae]MDL2408065.1 LacI family DNA-binding transcriptional regulator [Rhizobium calliandrae]